MTPSDACPDVSPGTEGDAPAHPADRPPSPHPRHHPRRAAQAVATLLLCAAALGWAWHRCRAITRLDATPFFPDESWVLYHTRFYDLFFLQRDFEHPLWFDPMDGPDQPRITFYLVGAWLHAAGLLHHTNPRRWDWDASWQANVASGALPDETVLRAARDAAAAIDFAAIAAVVLFAWAIGHPLAGALAAVLIAGARLTHQTFGLVGQDAPMLLFATLTLAGVALLFRRLPARATPAAAVAFGVLIGLTSALAVGAKLNGALAPIVAGLALALAAAWALLRCRRPRAAALLVITLVIAALTGALTLKYTDAFFFSQPRDGSAPPNGLTGGLRKMLNHRRMLFVGQQWKYPEEAVIAGPLGRAALVLERTLTGPRDFRERLRPGVVRANYATLGRIGPVPLDAAFALAGLLALAAPTMTAFRRRQWPAPGVVLLLWIAAAFGVTAALIPLDWDRYYLPLWWPLQILIAVGAIASARTLLNAARTALPRATRRRQ